MGAPGSNPTTPQAKKPLSPIAQTMLEMTKTGAAMCHANVDISSRRTTTTTSASTSSSSSSASSKLSPETRDEEFSQYCQNQAAPTGTAAAGEAIEIGYEDCLRQDYQLYRV
jgi:hypothetical protein